MRAITLFHVITGLFVPVASRQEKALQPFFFDVMKLFNSSSISIVFSGDFFQEFDVNEVGTTNPTSFLSYTHEGEVSGVAEHLILQKSTEYLDLILFLGGNHTELLTRLVNEEKIFSAGVVGLLPMEDYEGARFALRLDTKLIFYAWDEGRVVLRERYAVRGVAVDNEVGTWSEGTGFEVEKSHIWERRKDLLGSTVRVASVHLPPLHELHFEDANGKAGGITGGGGFFIEPLNHLAEELNFTLSFCAPFDGKFGAVDGNGTWNGLMGMVLAGEADLAAAALTRTKERDRATSFSVTLLEEVSTLAAPRSTKQASNLWVYVEIFPPATWALCGSMMAAGALMFAIIHASGVDSGRNGRGREDSDRVNIFNAVGLSALGSTMQLPCEVSVGNLASRIVFFFAGMSAYVLFAHYSADLTAQMTSGPKESAIKSFDDVKSFGGYRVVVEESTSMHMFLENSKSGTAMHQVYYDTMKNDPSSFVTSLREALDVVYSNERTLTFTSSLYELMDEGNRLEFLDIQGHTITFHIIKPYDVS